MGALLRDTSLLENINDICSLNRTQAMSNSNRRTTLGGFIQCCLNHLFRLGVERTSRFVQKEHFRILEERAGDGDALFLTAGKQGSFATAESLKAGGERGDEVVDVGGLAGTYEL